MSNLKVVNNSKPQYSVKQISDMIKADTWSNKQSYPTSDFLTEESPGVFIPNKEMIFQVRDVLYVVEFVDKQVIKINNTGDKSNLKKGTVVYFPEEVKLYTNLTVPADSVLLIDDTHGTVIKHRVGIKEYDYNIVNFKEHLNSDRTSLRRLGNLINFRVDEVLGLEDTAIKLEFYEIIDKNVEEGKEAKPTEDQQKDFLKCYEQINQATLTNWIAHHSVHGGRREPRKPWTEIELKERKTKHSKLEEYQNHAILNPTHLSNWNDGVLSQVWKECHEKNRKKALAIIYASNARQQEDLDDVNEVMKKRVKRYYKESGKFFGITIDVIFLPTK
jgi:hypothetical protein